MGTYRFGVRSGIGRLLAIAETAFDAARTARSGIDKLADLSLNFIVHGAVE